MNKAPYRHPRWDEPVSELPDGTPLYAAYEPYLLPGSRFRRSLSWWNGAQGEEYATTADGRTYRQSRYWGGQGLDPTRWERVKLQWSV